MKLKIPEHIMLKLRTWRDIGNTEVTGFFITEKDKPLDVIDAVLAKATCTVATVDIKPEDIQNLYIEQTKKGIYPNQLMIWWHTHPGSSATPSSEDINTFDKLGKDRTANYMYILSKTDEETFKVSVKDKSSGLMLQGNIQVEHPILAWKDFPDYDELKSQYDEKVVFQKVTAYNWQNNKSKFQNRHTPIPGRWTPEANQKEINSCEADYFCCNGCGEWFLSEELDENDICKTCQENFDPWNYAKNSEGEYFDAEEEAMDLFNEIDDMVTRGLMTKKQGDEYATELGWEIDFYTSRKKAEAPQYFLPGGYHAA